jgi:hypothetical protein
MWRGQIARRVKVQAHCPKVTMMATKRPAPVIEKELAEMREQLASLEKASEASSPEARKGGHPPSKAVGDKKLTEAKIAELEAELKSLGDDPPLE